MLVGARLSASEWTEGGFSPDEAVVVARALKEAGVGYVCASSGGNFAKAKIPLAPLYQVPFAEKIRREAGDRDARRRMITEPRRGGGDRRGREGRHGGARPRDPRRSALAVASRRALGPEFTTPPQYARAAATMAKWAAPAQPSGQARRKHGESRVMIRGASRCRLTK